MRSTATVFAPIINLKNLFVGLNSIPTKPAIKKPAPAQIVGANTFIPQSKTSPLNIIWNTTSPVIHGIIEIIRRGFNQLQRVVMLSRNRPPIPKLKNPVKPTITHTAPTKIQSFPQSPTDHIPKRINVRAPPTKPSLTNCDKEFFGFILFSLSLTSKTTTLLVKPVPAQLDTGKMTHSRLTFSTFYISLDAESNLSRIFRSSSFRNRTSCLRCHCEEGWVSIRARKALALLDHQPSSQ